VHKAALEITNRTGNGIDDLSREYSRYPADGSVDKVEALERRLESLESQVKDDLDQVIPGGRETYRDYIHRKKQELPELKKTVKDFHGIAAANQVRRIVSEYQDLLRSTGTFATQNELDTLRAKKAELDEISKKLDDPKVDGRSKLTPDDRVALEAVNKNHDTNISSRIHIEELRKKIDPLLTDHLKLLLSNGDPRVPIKTALVA